MTYVGLAGLNGLGSKHDSLHGGGADLVDGGGDGGLGETSSEGDLAGRVLACDYQQDKYKCDVSFLSAYKGLYPTEQSFDSGTFAERSFFFLSGLSTVDLCCSVSSSASFLCPSVSVLGNCPD